MSDWDRKPPEVMNELALFAGAGGGILGGSLLGWRTICAVERDDYAARVDRLKAIGNGQVPQCAAEAWRVLSGQRNHCEGL